jgi:Arc/MetJ family transcription regulator
VDEVGARPAVQKGRQAAREWGERPLTEAQEQARRELLFNQSNDKVRAAREAAVRALNA